MARIIFAVPIGQDMGGIITSTEQYITGIREAGHDVKFMAVVCTKRDDAWGPLPRGKFANDFKLGEGSRAMYHPSQGWRNEPRVSITCPEGLARWKKMVKDADLVIWASVYGFRNDATVAHPDWFEAIKVAKGKQIFMIHDDHLPARYPWGRALAPYGKFVGVQPCSFDSLQTVTEDRLMVYTPMAPAPKSIAPVEERSGFLSCQIWKPWKNADKLVAAAPYMPKGSVSFAGDGIQLRYLRSKDKCPEKFVGLWDAAMKKQKYLGVLSEGERDRLLAKTKYLVDMSLRHNSGQLNRIVQEAMMHGCVVIANPAFITGTREDPLFKPWKHYIPIEDRFYNDPKGLAARLKQLDKTPAEYAAIQKAARQVGKLFERKRLGAQLVEFGLSEYTGPRKADKAAVAEFEAVFGRKP